MSNQERPNRIAKVTAHVIGGVVLGEVGSLFAYGLELSNPGPMIPWQPFVLSGLVIGGVLGVASYLLRNTRAHIL